MRMRVRVEESGTGERMKGEEEERMEWVVE